MHLFLGFRHVGVSRPDDLVDLRHRLGPVGKGGNGLRPADLKNLRNAGDSGRRKDIGVHPSVGTGRRDHHDLLTARNPGRDQVHQNRGRIGRRAVGNIHAHLLDRPENLSHHHAVFAGDHIILTPLLFMIAADVLRGLTKDVHKGLIDLF